MIKLFVVDNHPIFRGGLELLIDTVDDITLVGGAASAEEAIAQLKLISPDVVLLGGDTAGEIGESVSQQLKSVCPNVAVLVMTVYQEHESNLAAVQAGACGYVSKGVSHAEMLNAVRRASTCGELSWPTESTFRGNCSGGSQVEPSVVTPVLTRRQVIILEQIYAGADTKTIARKLTLSPKTIRNYISRLMKTLDADSRADAVQKALDLGIIDAR